MKYFPVATDNLRVDTILNFKIYIRANNKFVLFRKGNHPFSEETLHRLQENKVHTVHVSEDDIENFEKYYYENVNKSNIKAEIFVPPFDQQENREKYYSLHLNYFPIERETLIPGFIVDFNVYGKNDLELDHILGPDREEGRPETIPEDIHESKKLIVIKNAEIPLYRKYLTQLTPERLNTKDISTELYYTLFRENSKLVVKEIFEDPRSGDNIQKATNVVEILVDNILNQENTFYNLMKIMSHDYYTYNHSLNVCSLSIGLGILRGLKRKPDLLELGLGALLHDIGNSMIDPCIINKPGKLTDEEYRIVQGHVKEGINLLEGIRNQIPQNSFFAILQHHEKLSGLGYPYKLKDERIHLFGRITGIVNFYDALVSDRPYKKALEPFDALKLMSDYQEDYDQCLMKDFVVMLGDQS
ncbi:MAG: HD domain-containing protein [Candidatus Scalindua sp. AMX11]|nr:MAG: HD domain-containing protein [Candidatus Scalindua sp.]NOG85797.1 HD domain-containing protein [Planctomycetota bacterium]RZV97027.1 MAG: HD domain-containing protein [Candidatus Scalindua sp. SCAELEC01]TDE66359.1 MAG: HD domain-containing protein [Candidatus Scalindua sp. AMX11]GJQ58249.1 MAG: metal-dependent phosphohydrolase [Candidatus Scalindua sp.]